MEVFVGDDAADHDRGVEVSVAKRVDHGRAEGHVAGVVHGQANGIGIFLLGCGDDAVGGLTQSEVDDLHPGVAQNAGDNLDATVVTVEAQLRQDDADLWFVTH